MITLRIKNCKYNRKKKKSFKKQIEDFIKKELDQKQRINITVDFNGAMSGSKKTYYQGFLDLFNLQTGDVQISLNYFIEFENTNNSKDCLWGIFHELVHVKQMYEKQLVVDSTGSFVYFDNQRFEKLPFRYEKFLDLLKENRKEATRYHIRTIPWEKDPYAISDLYTGIRSH